MRPIRIAPAYTLLLRYDIYPQTQEAYFNYIIREFTPTLQHMHIYLQNVWQVVHGEYPERQVEFITDDIANIRQLLESDEWHTLQTRLKKFVYNYTCRITRYSGNFKV